MVIKLYAGGCCSKLWFVYSIEQQSIAYNAFDKVTSIIEGDKSLQITYGHHRQRIGQQYTAAGSTTTKVYAGACEYITQNTQTTTLTYLSGPEGLFALHVKNPNGSEHIRYIHKDHLGSWHTITDENGNLLQELSFDAWGNRRNPNTWRAFTGAPPGLLFDRGFPRWRGFAIRASIYCLHVNNKEIARID